MILNCITIDDEPFALELLNNYIERTPFLSLAGSYNKSSQGLDGVLRSSAQLIFMDIQMPGNSGIDLARTLKSEKRDFTSKIIFTTAFNQYAYESYQVDALDYLLKPFEYYEFLESARKALRFFDPENMERQLIDETIVIKSGYKHIRIPVNQIKYIQGLKDYAAIHLNTPGSKPILTLSTQKALLAKLPAEKFIRVQRSFITAVNSVTSFSAGSLWIEDLEIKIGEQYKAQVQEILSATTS